VAGYSGNPLSPTTEEVRRITGIKRVRVAWGLLGNSVQFETEEDYKYTFYDETGDGYTCNVITTWWPHTFTYFSSKPNIVRITGK
jgi:hypothetical protein